MPDYADYANGGNYNFNITEGINIINENKEDNFFLTPTENIN